MNLFVSALVLCIGCLASTAQELESINNKYILKVKAVDGTMHKGFYVDSDSNSVSFLYPISKARRSILYGNIRKGTFALDMPIHNIESIVVTKRSILFSMDLVAYLVPWLALHSVHCSIHQIVKETQL